MPEAVQVALEAACLLAEVAAQGADAKMWHTMLDCWCLAQSAATPVKLKWLKGQRDTDAVSAVLLTSLKGQRGTDDVSAVLLTSLKGQRGTDDVSAVLQTSLKGQRGTDDFSAVLPTSLKGQRGTDRPAVWADSITISRGE
eukprot:2516699-Rhodomonas_salina.1